MSADALYATRLSESLRPSLATTLSPVEPLLSDDETIVTAVRARMDQAPIGGMISRRGTEVILLFTSARLLVAPLTLTGKSRGTISHVEWGDVMAHRIQGRRLTCTYRNLLDDTFTLGSSLDVREIERIMPLLLGGGRSTQYRTRKHICVECGRVLQPFPSACTGCGHAYLTESEARRMSLWYPGGGQFMLGRPILALAIGAIETLIVLATVAYLAFASRNGGEGTSTIIWMGALAFLSVHITSAWHAGRCAAIPHPREDGTIPTPTGLLRDLLDEIRRTHTRPSDAGLDTPSAEPSPGYAAPASYGYTLPEYAMAGTGAYAPEQPAAASPVPPPPAPTAPAQILTPTESKSRWYWPQIHDVESARRAARQGRNVALLVATLTSCLALIGHTYAEFAEKTGFDAWAFLDAALFFVIAFGIGRLSRTAAIAGFLLFLLEKIVMWADDGAANGWIVAVFILLAFLHSIRGTFAWHRYRREYSGDLLARTALQ